MNFKSALLREKATIERVLLNIILENRNLISFKACFFISSDYLFFRKIKN